MKNHLSLLLILFSFAAHSQGWTTWKYANTVLQGDTAILKLEYQTYTNHDWKPKIRWRYTNLINAKLYKVDALQVLVTGQGGGTAKWRSTGPRNIEPGDFIVVEPDPIWSKGDRIVDVKLRAASYQIEKSGERILVEFDSN